MYLLLGYGRTVWSGDVIAMTKAAGETDILCADGSLTTSFGPRAVDKRSRRFWEEHEICRKTSSKA